MKYILIAVPKSIKLLILLYILLISVTLSAQNQANFKENKNELNAFDLEEDPETHINLQTAKDLIKAEKYYRIYYGHFPLEYSSCMKSVANDYQFEAVFVYHACIKNPVLMENIKEFNAVMIKKLNEKLPNNWQQKIDSAVIECSKNFCACNGEVEKYLYYGMNYSIIGILYEKNQFELDDARKCLIDYAYLPWFVMYPKLIVVLQGNANIDEDEIFMSRMRVLKLKEYLMEKGISEDRILIESLMVKREKLRDKEKEISELKLYDFANERNVIFAIESFGQ